MFSSLSKIFQSSSQSPDPDSTLASSSTPSANAAKGKQKASIGGGSSSLNLASPARSARETLGTSAEGGPGSSNAYLTAHTISRTPSYPSSLALDRVRTGPSHVSWITNTPSGTSSGGGSPSVPPSPGRPGIRPSASMDSYSAASGGGVIHRDGIWRFPPMLANAILGNGGGGEAGNRSSAGRMSVESGSLHLQSVYLSDVDSNSVASVAGVVKQLSPIEEAAMSQGRTSGESAGDVLLEPEDQGVGEPHTDVYPNPAWPRTPSSNATLTPVQTPTLALAAASAAAQQQHQAFLTRPLRRSISQTSTSTTTGTFLTPTSAIPPSAVSTTSAHTFAYGMPPVAGDAYAAPPVAYNNNVPAGPPVAPVPLPVEIRERPPYSGSSSGALHFPLPVYTTTRRMQIAAPPSLPTVLASPPARTHPLPPSALAQRGFVPHTHVSIVYEYEDSPVAPPRDGPWRNSGRSVSFVTAPSVHFSEYESEVDDEVDEVDEEEEDLAGGGRLVRDVVYDDLVREQHPVLEDFGYEEETEIITPRGEYKRTSSRSQGTTPEHEERDLGDSRSHMSLPEGYCDVELGPPLSDSQAADASSGIGELQTRPVSWSSTFMRREYEPSVLETMSRHSDVSVDTDSDETVVERAIARRWLQGLSWGSFRSFRNSIYDAARRHARPFSQIQVMRAESRRKSKGKERENADLEAAQGKAGSKRRRSRLLWPDVSAAYLLFFLGFIAPWCWLIGGWCLSTETGHLKESEGQFVDTVDRKQLWWPKRKRVPKAGINGQTKSRWGLPFSSWSSKAGGANKRRGEETTPMTPVDVSVDSDASVHPVYSLHMSSDPNDESMRERSVTVEADAARAKIMDKWVYRCRVAAVVGGIILCIAVIIAAVAIAGVRAG